MKRCWKEKKGQILCVMTDDHINANGGNIFVHSNSSSHTLFLLSFFLSLSTVPCSNMINQKNWFHHDHKSTGRCLAGASHRYVAALLGGCAIKPATLLENQTNKVDIHIDLHLCLCLYQ